MDLISVHPMEQTKKDFKDFKVLQEFNNYIQLKDPHDDFVLNVYHYSKKNLCYGLFLHNYPINVVSNVVHKLDEKINPQCDCLLDQNGDEIVIDDFKEIFDLVGGGYFDYDDEDIQLEGVI
eukprot:gene8464-286_t